MSERYCFAIEAAICIISSKCRLNTKVEGHAYGCACTCGCRSVTYVDNVALIHLGAESSTLTEIAGSKAEAKGEDKRESQNS